MKRRSLALPLFRSVIESSPDPILITNRNVEIVFVNKAWERLTGYMLTEVLGKNPHLLSSGKTSSAIYQDMFSALLAGKSFTSEDITDKRKDGSEYQIRSTFYPIFFGGKMKYFVQSQHDITKRLAKTKEIAKTASLVQVSEDAMIATTLDGKIISWNRAAEQLFGYKQNEVVDKPFAIIVPEDKRKEVLALLKKIKAGDTVINYHTTRRHKDGTLVTVSLNASIIKDSAGKPTSILRVYRDITGQQKIEALKSEFLSIVAHELKTPLTTAKLYADLALFKARKIDPTNNLTSELGNVNHQLNRLGRLVSDILDVTRIESGKLHLNTAKTNLTTLLKTICTDTQLLGHEHTVVFHKAPEVLATIDALRIEQVIVNLLTNAMKYSAPGTVIDVWLKKRRSDVVISVKDIGEGIPKDKIKYIFDRFYQVTSGQQKGFGLGLYISKEIINRHNGKIWVRSTIGRGSRFSFSLPLKPPRTKN